ncbi:MAG TPA: hypothetical protein DCY13_24215 [Verrucomicrobiales bacterium]|nr:hypothetical protein [Verrucomicrobiales bacterium]
MTEPTSTLKEHNGNLAPAELRSRLAGEAPPQLVDVRKHAEFAGLRIAGARLLPLDELERRAGELDRGRPVVCVCRTGNRSSRAVERLRTLGFRDVEHLEGGLIAWEKAGLPVEKDANAPWAIERQVRFAAGLLVLVGAAVALVWPPAIALSWFVGAGLVFAAATDWCGMGLLLAKMPWNNPRQRRKASPGS